MMHDISMYESAMGESFSRLAARVQQFHRLNGRHVLHGQVEVHAPASILGKLLAQLLGTPVVAGAGPIKFELDAQSSVETWTRYFPSKVLTSQLHLHGSCLVEKLGVVRLVFELSESDGRLHMHLHRLQFFGIVCPKWLMPIIVAEELGIDNRLHFNISAEVRYVGVIARYHGYLLLPESFLGEDALGESALTEGVK